MAESLRPLRSEAFTDQQQAAFFHSRERRRSLAGVPELYRSHRVGGVGTMADVSFDSGAAFPDRARPITFQTAFEVTGAAPSANLFTFGTASVIVGLQTITATFGSLVATFDNGATFPVGLQIDLVVAVNPGAGMVRMWGNGRELVRLTDTPIAEWGDGAVGPFAVGPTDITVLEPLSAYDGQKPRHMV